MNQTGVKHEKTINSFAHFNPDHFCMHTTAIYALDRDMESYSLRTKGCTYTRCNSLGGTYKVNGDEITFSEITSTLMACEDERMAQEGVVTQVLTGTAEYEINGNTLTLTNNDLVLVFTAASTSYPYP
jgi:heat shock protein HslJ